jgi:single-strand DNA-binding protein
MINKVTLIGNLGGDPEVRTLENGTKVGRFSLATNENYKDKEGNWQSQTEWHNIVVWRELAERAEKYLKKGMQVFVDGKISYRKYTTQEGQERYVTDIVANQLRTLEKREGSAGGGNDFRLPTSEHQMARASEASSTPTDEAAPPPTDGDDLPF